MGRVQVRRLPLKVVPGTRHRGTAPGTVANDNAAPAPGADDGRSRVGRLVTSHWVWKAGVATTVVAVLLLKFG